MPEALLMDIFSRVLEARQSVKTTVKVSDRLPVSPTFVGNLVKCFRTSGTIHAPKSDLKLSRSLILGNEELVCLRQRATQKPNLCMRELLNQFDSIGMYQRPQCGDADWAATKHQFCCLPVTRIIDALPGEVQEVAANA